MVMMTPMRLHRPTPHPPQAPQFIALSALGGLTAIVAGCGSTPAPTTASPTPPTQTAGASASPSPPSQGPGALTGEAASAAAGDIPDNQVFLTLHDKTANFSIKYPEGWAQKGTAGDVTIRDKNNIVHITVMKGAMPSIAAVQAQIAQIKQTNPGLTAAAPATMTIGGAQAIKVTYQTKSAPNSVTGTRVVLIVDRYYLANGSRLAVIDLGTPQGVDNVDAYRMMIQSFSWKR
jgi:hypothetical protein